MFEWQHQKHLTSQIHAKVGRKFKMQLFTIFKWHTESFILIIIVRSNNEQIDKKEILDPLDPQAPVAQKIEDEVLFRCFQGEGVEFFLNQTSLTLPPILRFLMRIFSKIPI